MARLRTQNICSAPPGTCSCRLSNGGFLQEISISTVKNDRLKQGKFLNLLGHMGINRKSFQCYCFNARGGGYLVYLSYGDVPFFRVSFSPIFSRTGYQKKANFLSGAGCQNMSKEEILLQWVII